MQKRRIAKSGIDVSIIGLGTVKFGRNQGVKYPHAFKLPTDQEARTLLGCARDLGINLLDTAPAYGMSEERLGKFLKGERHDWVIASKAGESFHDGESQFDFSKEAIRYSVERSLKRLQTDYLDILLIHSNGDDEHIIHHHDVFATLATLKKEGKIRSYGMSTKTVEGGLLTLQHADIAMVSYRPDYQDEIEVIHYANQNEKSILIKKALASGHLNTQPPQEALAQIANLDGVTSIVVGTLNPEHLKQNTQLLNR